jgi:hypothetical protein
LRHFASTVCCQNRSSVFASSFSSARVSSVSVERLAGSITLTGLNASQIISDTPCRAASMKSCEWMLAEKLVMMIEATSSIGNCFTPSEVLQVNCPSRQEIEHCGASMLTMWKDIPQPFHPSRAAIRIIRVNCQTRPH